MRRKGGSRKGPKLGILPSLMLLASLAAVSSTPSLKPTEPLIPSMSKIATASRAIERNVKTDMEKLNVADISKITTTEGQEKALEFLTKYRTYRQMGQSMPVVTKEGDVLSRDIADTCAIGGITCGTFPRYIMPQIKDVNKFIKDANKLGIHLKKHEESITVGSADELKAKIRPSQSEIMASKVADKVAKVARKGLDPSKFNIVISQDGYIVDGHHTWNTLVNVLEADPRTVTFKVTVIEADILDILVAAAAVGLPNAPEYGWSGLLNSEFPKLKNSYLHMAAHHNYTQKYGKHNHRISHYSGKTHKKHR